MPGLAPVKIIIAGVDKFTSVYEKSFSKMNKLGQSVTNIGKNMTLGVTLPIIGASAAAFKFASDLNSLMANVQSLGLTTSRVEDLKNGLQSLAVTSGISTDIIAGGLYDLISAFGDSAETAQLLEINVKAASAGLSTVQEAISLTSAVTKGYGDTSARAVQNVSDLAFQTVKLGQTTFPELAKKQLPKSWEELNKVNGYYVDIKSKVNYTNSMLTNNHNNLIFKTENQAKSAIAMAKLSQLMAVYNDGWVSDWNDATQPKFCIFMEEGKKLVVGCFHNQKQFIAIKTDSLAKEFLENFREDIETYFNF
jgi:hypothetical protein